MTDQTKEPNFASEEAGEFWAAKKSIYGDHIAIEDVTGTGKDGAIKKGDIDAYMNQFPIFESSEMLDIAVGHAVELGIELNDFIGEENMGEVVTDAMIENILADLSADEGDDESGDDEQQAEPDAPDVEPIEGETLVNLTSNIFDIENVKIEPNGEIALTDELRNSKRVAHAIECGVLAIK